MKDCKKIHPLMPFYLEGGLSSSEKNKVEKHLSGCETARLELEHFRHLLQGLRNMPEPTVPADLHGKIMAKLGHNASPGPAPHGFWGTPLWAIAAAAVMVFVFLDQYPDWRDSLRAPKPRQEREGVAGAPMPAAPPEPAIPASRSFAPVPVNQLAPKKEESNKALAMKASPRDVLEVKNLAQAPKAQAASKPEEEAALPAAAPMAGAAKSRKAMARPEGNLMVMGNLPPQAPPAPTPTIPSLDQSLASLTYSKEQSVVTWNGNNGPSTMESQVLVTDSGTFQKYWQVPHPNEAPPAVDFTQNAVVILMAGEKPTAGYSIHVSRLEEKADQLVIHYRVETPAPDAVVAQIITYPWALQIIPKPSKPVIFLKDP